MSVNLMDLVKNAVSSQVGPIAVILGESEQKTDSVLDTAVPAILGGLMAKTSTNDGADEVLKTIDDYDGANLDNLGGLLAGGNHVSLLNAGSGLLGMIFGNNQTTITCTIANTVELGDGTTATILGLLTPVVMGVLGQQQRAQGLDAAGLTGILAGQQEYLKGKLPAELSDLLGFGEMSCADLNAADLNAGEATHDVADHRRPPTDPAAKGAGNTVIGTAADAGKSKGVTFKTLLPLIMLAVFAFLGYQYISGRTTNFKADVDNSSSDASLDGSVTNLNIPGFDTVAIHRTFGELTDAIRGIKDKSSVRLVLPEIEKASSMIDGIDLGALAGGPQSEAVAGLFGGLIPEVRIALDAAYGISGVREMLEPAIAPFLEQFAVFGL